MITPLASALVTGVTFLADEADPDQMKIQIEDALPIAGLFVLLLLVAMFFLWRSMRKQFAKIDPSLPMGPADRERAYDRTLTERAMEAGEAGPSRPSGKADEADDAPGR
jgi:hypothetical protein